MGERVLLLGAGASYGARRELVRPHPPLGNGLARYLVDWLADNDPTTKLRPFIDGYHYLPDKCPHYTGEDLWRHARLGEVRAALAAVARHESSPPNRGEIPFERLMDEWAATDDGQVLLHVAHRVLVYAMNFGFRCAFPQGRDRYDDLIAWFKPSVILTLNYDTLTEEAVTRASLRYSYPGLSGPREPKGPSIEQVRGEGNGDVIPFYKLHGSVNWHSIRGGGRSADEQVAERQARETATHLVLRRSIIVPQTWATYASVNRLNLLYELDRAPATGEPIVAVYGTGKPVLDNVEHVDQHREACRVRLRTASIERVLAIGVRPVSEEDDPILFQVLQDLDTGGGEKTYVSPSPDECEEFRRRGFSPIAATMEAFLSRCLPPPDPPLVRDGA